MHNYLYSFHNLFGLLFRRQQNLYLTQFYIDLNNIELFFLYLDKISVEAGIQE
nr:MAG TPA: hypothetical protein [Bacteriophage sp.]